jgi:hypothetical protein
MDAWAELESRLTAAGVPRRLWPKFWEREADRQLRQRIKDKDELNRIMTMRLQKSIVERERRRKFTDLLILMLWLLDEHHDPVPVCWMQTARQSVLDCDRPRMDAETIERLTYCLGWLKFGRDHAERLLPISGSDKTGRCHPLRHAIRIAEAIASDEQRTKTAQEPSPTPSQGVSPTDPEKTDQNAAIEADPLDELTDEQLELASPSF